MQDSEIIKKAEVILDKLLELLEISGAERKLSVEVDQADKRFLKVTIEGEELGSLIGYRGNTLNSLQLVFAQILAQETGEHMPVLIDINGYRKRRTDYLESLALRAAREAEESGQNVELPPLNALERRIVHLALSKEKGVTTESVGEEEERHVIVKIEKGK